MLPRSSSPVFSRRVGRHGSLGALSLASLLVVVACSKPSAPPVTPRTVLAQAAVAAPAGVGFALPGEVRSDQDTTLSFRVAGKLSKRLVRVGDVVHPGQVLAELDVADLQSLASIDQAGLQAADAHARWAQAQDQRTQRQQAAGLSAPSETEQTTDLATNAQATRDSARQRADLSARQLAYGRLVADDDGVITREDAQPGQVVAPGQPVFGFAHSTQKEIAFDLPESWLAQVHVGSTVQVQAPALGGQTVRAVVRHVGAAADPASRTFPVRAAVTGANPLALGMSVQVALATTGSVGAVRLPASALFHQADKPAVWLVDPKAGTLSLRVVQVLRYEGADIDVGGVSRGEWVVSSGVHTLDAHDHVQVATALRAADGQP
jgi:RND family efflux transporter MFP subunit